MYKKSGFTILEMLVAIAIIGLLATVVIPNLAPSKPKEERERFISSLNSLVGFAWQNAIVTRKTQKVECNFDKNIITISQAGQKDKYGKVIWQPIKRAYVKTMLKIPDQLELKSFYIEGEDKVTKIGSLKSVWFAISSGGISQEVIINFLDSKDKIRRRKRPVGLVINPFTAQFDVYDKLSPSTGSG